MKQRRADPPAPVFVAREGGIIYERRGDAVYMALPGCQWRYYCRAAGWEQSHAARRIRGEFGPPRVRGVTVED